MDPAAWTVGLAAYLAATFYGLCWRRGVLRMFGTQALSGGSLVYLALAACVPGGCILTTLGWGQAAEWALHEAAVLHLGGAGGGHWSMAWLISGIKASSSDPP